MNFFTKYNQWFCPNCESYIPPSQSQNQQYQEYYQRYGSMGTGGVICGVIGLSIGWASPMLGIVIGIIAVVLGVTAMMNDQKNGALAFFLGSASIIIAIIFLLIWISLLSRVSHEPPVGYVLSVFQI
jgi:hypothetical protein